MALSLTPSSSGASLGTTTASNALAADVRSLNQLKYDAGANNPAATKEAAKQFESLFMREMIKSMREATMKSGLLEGAQGDLGTELLDQQLSVSMSGLPGGLSEAISRQLSLQMGGAPAPVVSAPSTLSLARSSQVTAAARTSAADPASAAAANGPAPKGRDDFVQFHETAAERVAKESGIPAAYMLGQAGHETGWGKSEIRHSDGSNSFNLFGIKAGKGWTGKVAEITTTEYIDGKAQKVSAKFRAYDSYEDSFRDYAKLINQSPRYEQARAQTGSAEAYASALQKAGYATDPAYARKLSGAIQSALRVQRDQA
ncbi:MAG: flagellar assembly peptidoglycan hydrolase FlgJ [Giesbergeria sp.]|jgi:flagellar protein FlgJ|nr:flagellar assembly peptidoglycan hydrolase FlgJ [Giesbergeria sp.]